MKLTTESSNVWREWKNSYPGTAVPYYNDCTILVQHIYLFTMVHTALCVQYQYTCAFVVLISYQGQVPGFEIKKAGTLAQSRYCHLVINVYICIILHVCESIVQATSCLLWLYTRLLHLPVIGTLNFVTLYSATSLSREDDAYSSPISTDGAFRFGTGYVYSVYVRIYTQCTFL